MVKTHKMKIILAPDKFKGSLTGLEFCEAASKGVLKIIPDAHIVYCPLADGGDNTIEAVNYYLKGNFRKTQVNNPFFQKIEASYLYASQTQTAFIEMAEASGVKVLEAQELDCINATTFGTGELILNAIERGAKTIILGIGGSATNDCGVGMASALGYRFLDKNNNQITPVGKNLLQIATIDDTKVCAKLKRVIFQIACDVSNPLYGKNGAARVYAKQKGASIPDIELLDKGLRSFAKVLDKHFNIKSQNINGAGAAGGMGIGAKTFLNGELIPGIDLIKGLAQFDKKIVGADWVITGEGKLDIQTLSGKTLTGIVADTKIHKIRVAAFCGNLELSQDQLKEFGITYADELLNYAQNFEDSMANSAMYLEQMAAVFAERLINSFNRKEFPEALPRGFPIKCHSGLVPESKLRILVFDL
jgi:glycerate kinase